MRINLSHKTHRGSWENWHGTQGGWIDLSNSCFGINWNVDFLTALVTDPIPDLRVVNFIARDTISSQNGNGFWEPGETIEIFPLIKNYWGPTTDVRVGIEFAEFEDTSKALATEISP